MQIDQNAAAAIVIFGATYTGLLLFFCGKVATILETYGRRFDTNEGRLETLEGKAHEAPCIAAKLALKEGTAL